MTTSAARRTASTIRTTLALLAFTALAAVGLAAAREIAPLSSSRASSPSAPSHMPAATPHRDGYSAPARSPMPAHVFAHR